jgi:dipeptidyl aminopeptidase/acylaminoacyl peptidase
MVDRFAIDGPYTTAFAAQPLAGKGFVVAQLEEDWGRVDTPNEVTDEASQYEGVIDFLTAKEIIDPKRVGIIGFSRTGLAVEYVLTHSKYHFAAASLADISDAGYFRYIALLNASGFGRDSEIVNGDIPFGDGLTSWLKSAPGFNLDKVDSPVLMEANDRMSLLFEWEWFAGLSRLGRPVQLVYLPDGAHVVTKPSHRVVSQQGNVDWFRFWLQDYEDPDPAKIDQYKRWRELRKMQERKS